MGNTHKIGPPIRMDTRTRLGADRGTTCITRQNKTVFIYYNFCYLGMGDFDNRAMASQRLISHPAPSPNIVNVYSSKDVIQHWHIS